MILNRRGNKARIAKDIIPHFPKHKFYIEMFFGAGGMFFNKPKAKYNFLNDLDAELFNFWLVVKEQKEDLLREFLKLPLSKQLANYWGKNEESDKLFKAVRFLFFSNCTLHGKGKTLRISTTGNEKSYLLKHIDETFNFISDAKILGCDFRRVLSKIGFIQDGRNQEADTFIYADPPYLGTKGNYEGFTETDTKDLFKILVESNIRFAISEFDNPIILDIANDYGLNVITIGERQNLKNRRTEILITNYQKRQMELFDFSQSLNSV